MAAPSGTVWGSVDGNDKAKLGLYITTSNTTTQTTVSVQVWIKTKWSVSDTSNTLYFDMGTSDTTATTSRGAVTVKTSSDSSWNSANEIKLWEKSWTYDRAASAKSLIARSRLSSIEVLSGDITVKTTVTIPALPTYTISYNANGGSGAPSSQTKTHGTTLTLSSTKPTRTGHTFLGWSTSSSATSASYSAGGSYTSNSSATLYAVWSANTYTISYNANGGSGAPSSHSYTYASSGSVNLSSTKPTRTGYTFLGWSLSSTATSASYSAGQAWARSNNSNYTLYAVWKINTYTITYNANGGSGAPSSQTKTYGTALTLSSTKPTRTGYTFQGWSTSSSATSASYSAGGSYTSNSAATLYAVWKANTYTISYNANGGSGAPSSHSYTYASSGTTTLSSTKPTRTGYSFLGWSLSSTATSASYSAGQGWNLNNASNYTLYAVWQINTYTITYNANGGSGAPSATTYTYASSGTVALSSTKPTRTGYTFLGWSTSSSATSATYSSGGSFNKSTTSNTTLYAVWQINTYTITYNANGGSGAPSAQTKTYGTALTLSSTVPTKSGYSFLGWSTSSTATSATYSAGGNYTENSSATLYAVWTQASFIQTIMARYQQSNGSYTSYSQVYAAPLEQGNTCSWSSQETDEYYGASVSYTVGTSAETKYVDINRKQYAITFNANGGTGAPSNQVFYYGCDLKLKNRRPTKSGYEFLGWSENNKATIPTYKQNDSISSTDLNITLYAIWQKKEVQNIYLYDTGKCEAKEFIESDSIYFGISGEVYAKSFKEEILGNNSIALGSEFIASEISEIYIVKYNLIDGSDNIFIDENGNYLYIEEEE